MQAAVVVAVLLPVLAALVVEVTAQQVGLGQRVQLIQAAVRAVRMLAAVQPVVAVVLESSLSALLTQRSMLRGRLQLLLLVAESFIHSPRPARSCSEVNDGTLCSIR
jgi:hypothetical protein